MNLWRVFDSFLQGYSKEMANEEGLRLMAELLIEEIKNTSPDELAKRIKDAKFIKHKQDNVCEFEITLSEFHEPKSSE